MNRPKILIVDDHPLFRAGLRQVIQDDDRFELVGQTGDGREAMLFIEKNKPDVAVLDLKLPGMSGLEIARRAQEKRSPTRIIILTMHNEEELCNRAMDHGVMGFILKENAVEEIINAIAAVAEGQHYFSPSVSGHLVRRRQRADSLALEKPGLKDLTKAELRILKLIAMKKTSREIAAELFISPRTVEAHRANISSKLELRGSHSLLYFALSHKSEL
ncbi:MAG TPA: response regulator transcription factor [Candidatus Acidoferrales bacterium]|nr:response regulator transcription factor [Candidatus Acidoferrales bacterium]